MQRVQVEFLISFSHGWTSNRQKEGISSLSLRIYWRTSSSCLHIDCSTTDYIYISNTWDNDYFYSIFRSSFFSSFFLNFPCLSSFVYYLFCYLSLLGLYFPEIKTSSQRFKCLLIFFQYSNLPLSNILNLFPIIEIYIIAQNN